MGFENHREEYRDAVNELREAMEKFSTIQVEKLIDRNDSSQSVAQQFIRSSKRLFTGSSFREAVAAGMVLLKQGKSDELIDKAHEEAIRLDEIHDKLKILADNGVEEAEETLEVFKKLSLS